jgi:uncharacterized repeat protein (TIGR01451 family)
MEVGKMPAQRKKNQSRRRTAAGLIAVTAGTLLMMVWAIFPTAAFATVPWDGNGVTNGQFNNSDCNVDPSPHIFWIFTGDPGPGLTDVTLTVNGQTFDMNKAGGGNSAWQGTSSFFPLDSITASVDGVGGILTISHGCPGEEKTPNLGITKSATSTQVTEGGAVSYTITVTNTGNGDATGVVVTDNLNDALTAVSATFDGPGQNDVSCAVATGNQITCTIGTLGPNQSATVTINATAPQLPLPEGNECTLQLLNQASVDSDQTAPKTSNQVTVTVTGTGCEGGGGGGGTTTPPPAPTTPPAIAPTTIHKSTTTTDEVLPTTVKPSGTAFTGAEDVVPIGTLALILMTSGSGLLWAGARRRRHDGSEDED